MKRRTDSIGIDRRRRSVLRAVGAGAALPALAGVGAAAQVRTVVDFDPPDQPENLVIDADGNVLMSMALTRELRKLPADLTRETGLGKGDTDLVATVGAPGTFVTGVDVADDGTLYAANTNFDPAVTGAVWSVAPDGTTTSLASLPVDAFPNGVLLDAGRDRLLVTDSFRGEVWAVALDGSGATTWLDHPSLDPAGFIGANGLAVSQGVLHVANLDFGRIVRVPIEGDGSAGPASVPVEDPALVGADGIAFHNRSTLHVSASAGNAIRRVKGLGKRVTRVETVVSGDPLDFPADVAFGARGRGHLYVANFAFGSDPATANPALLRTHP